VLPPATVVAGLLPQRSGNATKGGRICLVQETSSGYPGLVGSEQARAAGLRPCPQCRPGRLSWSEPEPLCHAVRLILDGALDEADEACLAARLGVSARHLRRLFMTQLGITPDGLARSHRAHFARRLLDDTDLSITEIAFTAGYGSARQFNRDCLRIFHATPSHLRAARSSPARLAADGGLTLRLRHSAVLDWEALAALLADRAVPGTEHVDGPTYRRTIDVDGDPGVLELGPGGQGYLLLRLHLPHWAGLVHLVVRARRIAGLGPDIPGCWDPYEAGIAAIVAQHRTPQATSDLLAQIVRRFGRPVPGVAKYRLTRTFPPSGVLAAAEASLATMGLAHDQARAVSAFADAVATGAVRLDGGAPLEKLVTSLTAIPGVGASTARYVALRTGEADTPPAGDSGLVQAMRRLATSHSTLTSLASRGWRPWRSYAVEPCPAWQAPLSR
jgi:AraC family transcriptional regulator, regulatory protein of adaptative response / DNA-3-methyladenine glycosylase II